MQPAAGDAGTALGAALQVRADGGDAVAADDDGAPWAGSGRDDELAAWLRRAARAVHDARTTSPARSPTCSPPTASSPGSTGRSEFGPRALGHRSLLAHPGRAENLERLNDVKGREQFRPVAPMVLLERAAEIFRDGPLPSPYMLFVHDVAPEWRDRIPAVVHVDGTARIQTVDDATTPRVARAARAPSRRRTGLPGGRQHQPEHRRAADGGRPAGRAGAFGSAPVDAAGARARTSCARAGLFAEGRSMTDADAGMPSSSRPSAGRASPRCSTASPARTARCRRRSSSSTTGRDAEPAAAAALVVALPAARRARAGAAARRPRATSAGGSRTDRVGRLPRRRRRAARRLGRRARRRPRAARPATTAARRGGSGCRCPTDRRPTDWERVDRGPRATRAGPPPTWPTAGRRCWRSTASTSASPAPTGRTPTSPCGCGRRAGGSAIGAARGRTTRCARPVPRPACGCSAATPTTP